MIEPARVPALLPDGSLTWFSGRQSVPVVWQQGFDPHDPVFGTPEAYVYLTRHSYVAQWGERALRLDMVAQDPPVEMRGYMLALLREVAPDLVQERRAVDYSRGKPEYMRGRWWYT